MKWKASTTQPTVSGLTTSTPKAPEQGLCRHVRRLDVALGVFTPERPLEAVFREKLAYLKVSRRPSGILLRWAELAIPAPRWLSTG